MPASSGDKRFLSKGLRLGLSRSSLFWAGLAGLFAVLYGGILADLVKQWWTDPNYSHGFLVPLAAAYFGWRMRDRLARLPRRPTQWGLALLLVSQGVLLVGVLGAEFFLQRSSLLLLLAGGILFLFGWGHLRALAFPLALLLLAIPLPAIVFNAVAFPLQLTASSWAEGFLHACQVPVFREGNILVLTHLTLSVTEACSGIRSLVSLFTLALVVAYFLPFSFWLRGVLVVSALPITLLTNSLRVSGTGLLGEYWGESAARGFFHTFSGWLVFLLALGLLFSESVILERWRSWRNKRKESR